MNDRQQGICYSIRELLDASASAHRCIHHEPTRTSEQSARVRGEEIRIGGEALLVKTDDLFRLFVLSAACKFRSSAIKRRFGCKRVRFASADELMELTGLVPGCVPPFGRPVLPFELFVDESIVVNERIAFNAGSLTDSIIMNVDDYLRVASPELFKFSVPTVSDA